MPPNIITARARCPRTGGAGLPSITRRLAHASSTARSSCPGLELATQLVIHRDFVDGVFDGRPAPRHYQEMTEPPVPPEPPESPEPSTQPTPVNAAPPPYAVKGSRLYQAAAWVVIVAGIVFIVGVIFFAGAAVAWHNQPYHYHHPGLFRPVAPDGPGPGAGQWLFVLPGGPPPGMGPAGPGGPPMMPGGPGMGPGGPGMGPGQPPSTPPLPPGR